MPAEYLNGLVELHRLPCFSVPPGAPQSERKRLFLSQGELAQFHSSKEEMHYMAAVELVPGSVRGNHYHLKKIEFLYVISGRIRLAVRDLKGGPEEELMLEAGDLAKISPGVIHALRPAKAGWAIEFSPQIFDPQDTYRQ